jgi:hypothetical protein
VFWLFKVCLYRERFDWFAVCENHLIKLFAFECELCYLRSVVWFQIECLHMGLGLLQVFSDLHRLVTYRNLRMLFLRMGLGYLVDSRILWCVCFLRSF